MAREIELITTELEEKYSIFKQTKNSQSIKSAHVSSHAVEFSRRCRENSSVFGRGAATDCAEVRFWHQFPSVYALHFCRWLFGARFAHHILLCPGTHSQMLCWIHCFQVILKLRNDALAVRKQSDGQNPSISSARLHKVTKRIVAVILFYFFCTPSISLSFQFYFRLDTLLDVEHNESVWCYHCEFVTPFAKTIPLWS